MMTGWIGTKKTLYLSLKGVSKCSIKMLFEYVFQLTTRVGAYISPMGAKLMSGCFSRERAFYERSTVFAI